MSETSGYRILIVDDDPDILLVVGQFLAGEGFSVMTAPGGREAIRQARVSEIDLVLQDLSMPVFDGIATLRELRKTHPNLPFVMMTAYRDAERVVEAVRAGAVDCLFKPFELKELRKVILSRLKPRL